MRPRDYLLTLGVLAVLASAAVALLGHPSAAGELPPPTSPEREPAASAHGDVPEPMPVSTAGGAVSRGEVAVADPVFRPSVGPDTTGWTSGVIAGDIPLTASILPEIQSISVVIDELKNVRSDGPPPFRRIVRVELGVGTPTFVIRDVPFSDYGYVVRAHSPGLNGGQATVSITKDHPYVDDLNLPLTPGSPFSLLLRDQDRAPVAFTDVRLLPVGEPLGRSRFDGKTDNFGSVVFEQILAGDYQVFIGPPGQPLMAPPIINVQPGAYLVRGTVVQPQGMALTVPRGMPVVVSVADRSGYPVLGARVRLRATDRTQLLELVGETDVHGQVHYPTVLAGMWEIEVAKADHQASQKQLTIKAGETPAEQTFTLVRLR